MSLYKQKGHTVIVNVMYWVRAVTIRHFLDVKHQYIHHMFDIIVDVY